MDRCRRSPATNAFSGTAILSMYSASLNENRTRRSGLLPAGNGVKFKGSDANRRQSFKPVAMKRLSVHRRSILRARWLHGVHPF
ncbi:hypothetical protein PC113_g14892 [Phytophthora cactorum]|uniref:Uncharacterized protein n=1 Tax=Phytophthora cactorum TaxID=29920 RepID=A0A8T0YQL1_9STRA|nr:hypothetical protein PC111_g13673 [Phytophthora cactorum]KAG2852593.1 hypothetical protein PC113_g14892 [Phytophthora cactorum]KAG2893691.1 hypothetical protein PC114_g16157 [Phytophthora cactorum]KAG2906956.1 hypothetical protein PC115_g14104 [Phytophthora cactorum]KAG3074008.1 hypothetical protein PC122_g14567 [Phytophthora cactorum]